MEFNREPVLHKRSFNGGAKLSRDEAEAAGADLYWSGKPCVHGHLTFRYVSCHKCVYCVKLISKKKAGHDDFDSAAVDLRRALEDRPRKPKDEYGYDL